MNFFKNLMNRIRKESDFFYRWEQVRFERQVQAIRVSAQPMSSMEWQRQENLKRR
jgi:hypothetical protein